MLDAQTTDFIPQVVRQAILETDFYWVENVRTARRFISALKTGRKIDDLTFFVLDKRTSVQDLKKYIQEIPPNSTIGIMSEAGCPSVADPGSIAVRYAHQNGWEIVPLAGFSSILAAVMTSGMMGQSFAFQGYLPIAKNDRKKSLKKFEKQAFAQKQMQIFIETPYRNNALLKDMLTTLNGEIWLSIATEVTSDNRLIRSQKIRDWKQTELPDLHKRPTVFSIFSD